MKKKIIALVLCLTLMAGIAIPGTLAVGLDTAESSSDFTVENSADDTPAPAETEAPVCTCPDVEGVDKTAEDYVHVKGCDFYVPVCTCEATEEEKAAEDFVHAKGCDFYVPVCTCEATEEEKAAEDFVHAKGCDFYVPVCTCEATEEEKAAEGFVHSEGCDFYAAPVDPNAELYEQLMACESFEELDKLIYLASEETLDSLMSSLTEEELQTLQEHILMLESNYSPEYGEQTTVPCTNAGPFLMSVSVPYTGPMLRARFRSVAATNQQTEYGSDDGLGMKKTAVYDPSTGETLITLEAFTTGEVKSSVSTTPCDIIFVIDQSGSMSWGMGGENAGAPYRLDTVKELMQNFLSNVVAKTKDSAGNVIAHHRIAVVGFSSSGYNNNELLTGVTLNGTNGAQYGSITDEQYRVALQDVSNAEGQTNVSNAIKALTANGGTEPTYGLEMAQNIFANDPGVQGEENRNRVVIFLTDGVPDNIGSTGYGHEVAEEAVAAAYPLKSAYGATVYSVGIFNGADPDYIGVTGTAMRELSETDRANRFMNLASSNYPAADNFYLDITTILGIQFRWLADVPPRSSGNYYLAANDKDKLNEIFTLIETNISEATINLGTDTIIRDVISDQFVLPEGADGSGIKLYTAECTGKNGDEFTFSDDRTEASGVTASISDDGKTIEITGFNFNDNYVTADAKPDTSNDHGRKLIVEFSVKTREGFLGGNTVATNGENSGVYVNSSSSTPIESFDVPAVDIPIPDVTVDATDKNVYLFASLDEQALLSGAIVKCGDVVLDLMAENYGLEEWQTAYVDLNKGNMSTMNNLTADTDYSLAFTIAPKNEGLYTAKTESDTATVNVFKPEVSFTDDKAYYGDIAPDRTDNASAVVWKHGNAVSTNVTMTGEAPEITIITTTDASAIKGGNIAVKTDIPVEASAKIGNTDIAQYITFKWSPCSGDDADKISSHLGNEESPEFYIHVKTCQLTVTKAGGNEGEPYVFTIYKDGAVYTSLTIVGNSSKTIYELPVGTYSIAEDTGWSWRFGSPAYTGEVTLSSAADQGTAGCTNSRQDTRWLNDYSDVVLNIFGIANTKEAAKG